MDAEKEKAIQDQIAELQKQLGNLQTLIGFREAVYVIFGKFK